MDFFHPRTDPMVSFMGPENASAQQIQYLHVSKPWQGGSDLSDMKFNNGVIFTVTQFTHIPMADVFKVLQYWSFEPKKDIAPSINPTTIVRMYVGIHYNKYTMLKSKILSGTKDDLVELVKAWAKHVVKVIEAAPSTKKKAMRRRKSSLKGDGLALSPAISSGDGVQIIDLFTETNAKVGRVEEIVKEAMQQQKSGISILIYIVTVLGIVVAIQFLMILRLWSRS